MIWQRYRGQSNKAIHDAHTRLGPVVRLGLTEISVNCLEGLHVVYGGNFAKDKFYARFANFDEPNMFSILERQAHTKRRRMFGSIYSKSALQSSAVIRELSQTIFIERLLPVIDSAVRDGTSLNMLDYGSAVYSDFTTAFVFGLQSASNFVQDQQSRDRWLATKRLVLIPFWTLGFPPGVSSFLTKLGINLENPQMNSAVEEMNDMYLNMLQTTETLAGSSRMSREENQDGKWTEPVVYRQFINQLQSSGGNPPSYPPPESQVRFTIVSELMDHVMAGTDTSAATLSYLMQELSQRPGLQSSLREELLSLSPPILYPATAPDDEDPNPSEALPSPRAVDALPLLDAILRETLRLHTPVAGSLPRVTSSRDPRSPITILGYPNIPPGTCVSAQAYSLHRNPKVFPDPERWKPERWLETEGRREKRGEMMSWFWPFGSGPDMCIGNHLAMLQLKIVVAAIYTNYTTKIIDDMDMEHLGGYFSGPKGQKLILQFERAE